MIWGCDVIDLGVSLPQDSVRRWIIEICLIYWSTMVQNNQESRHKFWATCSFIRSHRSLFRWLCSLHCLLCSRALLCSSACSLILEFVEKWMIRCLSLRRFRTIVHQWRCLVYRRMTSFHDHPQDSSSRRVSSSPVDNSFLFYISIYLGYLFSRSFSRTKFKFFSRHAHMAIDAAIGRESKKKRSGGSFTSFFLFISPSLFCSLCIKQILKKISWSPSPCECMHFSLALSLSLFLLPFISYEDIFFSFYFSIHF